LDNETHKIAQHKSVPGWKVLATTTWGCLLFTLVMAVSTYAIGKYVGGYLKARHDAELAREGKQPMPIPHPDVPPMP